MKKTACTLIILAGVCLLVGILMKLGAVPHFLGTVPSSFVQLTMVFLLAAIAVKCCCKCHHKHDGEKKEGDSCCK